MNELHLFAGAGGGILGGMLLGHTPVCAVEIEEYPRRVLLQRQRDGILPRFPIWDDIQTFDGKPWRGRVDVVCGGFPCQDISAAGRGAGIEGARSGLWGEMARVIGEIQPRFVFVENSPLLVGRGLAVVLGDLAEMGYDARWCVLGADDAGAPHRRKRIWLLADSGSLRSEAGIPEPEQRKEGNAKESHHNGCGQGAGKDADTNKSRLERQERSGTAGEKGASNRHSAELCGQMANARSERYGNQKEELRAWRDATEQGRVDVADTERTAATRRCAGLGWRKRTPGEDEESGPPRNAYWITEPDVGRVADGVACRVDRLKAIGNGQVPHVAALAWEILAENDQEQERR